TVEKWLKGSEVSNFEKDHVYVVEFWATWCKPCKESIPHLTELQKEYKDKVTIIGVNVTEDPKYTPETLTKVDKFVKDMGDKMSYTVAFDGAARGMDKAYMEAANQNGIPTAFIINGEGKVAWIGNPLDKSFDHELSKLAGSKEHKDKKKDKDADV